MPESSSFEMSTKRGSLRKVKGVQRGKNLEGTGRFDTSRLCTTAGNEIGYSEHWTLNPTATEDGGTSVG